MRALQSLGAWILAKTLATQRFDRVVTNDHVIDIDALAHHARVHTRLVVVLCY